jgi:hypothetical protein
LYAVIVGVDTVARSWPNAGGCGEDSGGGVCAERKKLKLESKQDDGDIRTKGRMREGGRGDTRGRQLEPASVGVGTGARDDWMSTCRMETHSHRGRR